MKTGPVHRVWPVMLSLLVSEIEGRTVLDSLGFANLSRTATIDRLLQCHRRLQWYSRFCAIGVSHLMEWLEVIHPLC